MNLEGDKIEMERLGSMVPSFARGLNILVVDHDTSFLLSLSSMLELYSYNVTTSELAGIALSMIQEQKGRFKLVLANINMPDMDSSTFLRQLLMTNIPFIFISPEERNDEAVNGIVDGATFCLQKPICLADLKYIWQHALKKEIDNSSNVNETETAGNGFRGLITDQNPGNQDIITRNQTKGKEKLADVQFQTASIVILESNPAPLLASQSQLGAAPLPRGESNILKKTLTTKINRSEIGRRRKPRRYRRTYSKKLETIPEESSIHQNGSGSSSGEAKTTKQRIHWTVDLHKKFIAAIIELGEENGRPRQILEKMNEPGLTISQIASHLQKYRGQVQRVNGSAAASKKHSSASKQSSPGTPTFGSHSCSCSSYSSYLFDKNKSAFFDQLGQTSPIFTFPAGGSGSYLFSNATPKALQEPSFPSHSSTAASSSSLYENTQSSPSVLQDVVHQNLSMTTQEYPANPFISPQFQKQQQLPEPNPFTNPSLPPSPTAGIASSSSLTSFNQNINPFFIGPSSTTAEAALGLLDFEPQQSTSLGGTALIETGISPLAEIFNTGRRAGNQEADAMEGYRFGFINSGVDPANRSGNLELHAMEDFGFGLTNSNVAPANSNRNQEADPMESFGFGLINSSVATGNSTFEMFSQNLTDFAAGLFLDVDEVQSEADGPPYSSPCEVASYYESLWKDMNGKQP